MDTNALSAAHVPPATRRHNGYAVAGLLLAAAGWGVNIWAAVAHNPILEPVGGMGVSGGLLIGLTAVVIGPYRRWATLAMGIQALGWLAELAVIMRV